MVWILSNFNLSIPSGFVLPNCVGLENGTHVCDYLMACDMEMDPISGFKLANWERGFGDFHLVPGERSLVFSFPSECSTP